MAEMKCGHKRIKCRACLPNNNSLWLCDLCYKELSIQIGSDLVSRIFDSQTKEETNK